MKHDDARDGLFLASISDERWPPGPFFDTAEEAAAHGATTFAGDHGFYVGKVETLTDEEVADAFVRDEGEADECLISQDEWAWCEDQLVVASDAALDELRALTLDWVKRHSVRVPTWCVMDAVRHVAGGAP